MFCGIKVVFLWRLREYMPSCDRWSDDLMDLEASETERESDICTINFAQ